MTRTLAFVACILFAVFLIKECTEALADCYSSRIDDTVYIHCPGGGLERGRSWFVQEGEDGDYIMPMYPNEDELYGPGNLSTMPESYLESPVESPMESGDWLSDDGWD